MRLARWFLVPALAGLAPSAVAAEATLVTLRTPRGVEQKFILVLPPRPVAAVVLFAGGHGGLGLAGPNLMKWGRGNFLVRSRRAFADRGFAVAVVDAPADHTHMTAIFRMSRDHGRDIAAVVDDLRRRTGRPVWLVGTSMGTFSAANGAIRAGGVAGLVLTSAVTRSARRWRIAGSHPDGVASMPLDRIAVPVLVVAHRADTCAVTPPAGAALLRGRLTAAARVRVVLLDGGRPAVSDPCQAHSAHGFFGIEAQTLDAIAAFIGAR